MLFAISGGEQFMWTLFLMMIGLIWLAKKAAANPAVQKGALDIVKGYFKK